VSFRSRSVFVGACALALATWSTRAQTPVADVLSRPEFDKPLSIQLVGLEFAGAFAVLSRQLQVPFILDFKEDGTLRVMVSVKATPAREVLAGLAKSYDLDFAWSDKGVVITRRGAPRLASPVTLGEWGIVPNIQYDIELALRNPAGQTLVSRSWTTLSGYTTAIKHGFDGRTVMRFDRERAALEPRAGGGMEVAFVVVREVEKELQLIVELTVEQVLGDNTFASNRTSAKALAPNRETVVLRTPDGYEVRVLGWRRSANAATR